MIRDLKSEINDELDYIKQLEKNKSFNENKAKHKKERTGQKLFNIQKTLYSKERPCKRCNIKEQVHHSGVQDKSEEKIIEECNEINEDKNHFQDQGIKKKTIETDELITKVKDEILGYAKSNDLDKNSSQSGQYYIKRITKKEHRKEIAPSKEKILSKQKNIRNDQIDKNSNESILNTNESMEVSSRKIIETQNLTIINEIPDYKNLEGLEEMEIEDLIKHFSQEIVDGLNKTIEKQHKEQVKSALNVSLYKITHGLGLQKKPTNKNPSKSINTVREALSNVF